MIDIKNVIDRIDIVQYISQYVDLQKRNNEYIGLSPFSGKDMNPSFSITPKTQLYYDFSHGSGGNVLNFIQRYHNCNFKRALELATEYLGGDVKNLPTSLEATKQVKKFQQKQKDQKQVKYKKLPSDIMSRYDFDLNKLQIWIDEGISLDVLKKYFVRYDLFSNRIVYPIFDEQNNIINVKGRTLDTDFQSKKISKYQNFYDIGRMDYVYNLNYSKEEIKKKNKVIIFEAEKSTMFAETYGIKNTIALMTSTINDWQMELLIKLRADIVFALDKDKDIIKDKNIIRLKRYLKIQYLKDIWNLIDEKDSPIDKGYEIFKYLYSKRFNL